MKKFIILSTKEALLIHTAISHWTYHLNCELASNDKSKSVQCLDDLDLCDKLRLKISKVFPDLSHTD